MSVNRARSGTGYEARWRENGRARQATFRTKRAAEEAERNGLDRAQARRHGLPVDQGPIAYGELCDRFLAQYQQQPRSKRTVVERLTYSRKTFDDVPVRDMQVERIGAWNAALVPADMRSKALGTMRQILNAGVEWGYLASNPAKRVRGPKSKPPRVRPFESWAEVDAVAAQLATCDAALVRFITATGLRPQEWQVLRWFDLDVRGRTCRVQRTYSDGTEQELGKTSAARRTIVLQQRALEALAMLPRPLDRNQLVFTSPDGLIVNVGNFGKRVWHPALTAAGLPSRPVYQCRHTFATLALAAGATIEWISKYLGHTGIRVTLRHYARFLPAVDERSLAALDAFGVAGRAQNAHALSVNGRETGV